MKQSIILAGNYGSGKTEIALNLALHYSQMGSTVLVDMDVVNPYFRSSDHEEMLLQKGIELIKPIYANTQVDLPSISPKVYTAFNYYYAIFDGGGDPVGATVFGSIADKFDKNKTFFGYVVNTKRPLQQDADHIINMMREIESAVCLPVNGFINNTNLGKESAAGDIYEGDKILREVYKKTGIKTAFGTVKKQFAGEIKDLSYPVFSIETYTKLPFCDVD